MRITTNSMMRNYNSRLSRVLNSMNVANEKVITGRKFLNAAEAPADAARTYQLRRSQQKNADYLNNLDNVTDVFSSAESSLMNVSKIASTAYTAVLDAINGTKGQPDREILAEELRGMQKSIVMNLNSKFDDKFLFGGSSTKNQGTDPLPFELKDDGKLYFRGIDVNTTDPAEQQQLKELSSEKIYVDLGFGMKEDATGTIIGSSAFNVAIPGIQYVGFGPDATDNLVTNLGKIADLLSKETVDTDAMKVCTDKLSTQKLDVLKGITKLGADTQFLGKTKIMLEDNEFNLSNKIANVEKIDMEKAIMDFKEANYVYMAALKMGSSILSSSFIDFMR